MFPGSVTNDGKQEKIAFQFINLRLCILQTR